MDVLLCLASHGGAVVSKRRLIDTVWQSNFVSESVLTRAIGELRSTLGDDARNPRYIQTIPKRGYRLIAEVHTDPNGANGGGIRNGSTAARRWPYAVAAALVVAGIVVAEAVSGFLGFGPWFFPGPSTATGVRAPRIVVLPFDNLGPTEDTYFAFGIAEEITSRLGAVSGLRVISRTSAFNYDRRGKSVVDIGRDLDVDYVLEGSVRWERDPDGRGRVRITPQLIRVSDDSHVWSTTYDRFLDDVFEVQAEIGQHVVTQLNVRLLDSEQRAIEARPTDDLDAYQAYLHGCGHLFSDEQKDLETAVAHFERAVELAPDFARAFAKLANAHGYLFHYGRDSSPARIDRARRAIERAVELNPDLPDVRSALGLYHLCARDHDRALEEFRAAAAAHPSDSQAIAGIGYVQQRRGEWDRSTAHFDRALELDPLNPHHLWNWGVNLSLMRRYDEADRAFDRAIEVAPRMRTPYIWKAYSSMLWTGTTTRARQLFAEMPGPRDSRWLWRAAWHEIMDRQYEEALSIIDAHRAELATNFRAATIECFCLFRLDRPQQATESCRRAIYELEGLTETQTGNYWLRLELAKAYALIGDREAALTEAQRALDLVPASGDAVMRPTIEIVVAQVHARVGEPEEAIRRIERLLSIPSMLSVEMLRLDPFWDHLRSYPRFQELLAGS
jgi:TolB-like protein/Tfp pilus assembly protein PilF